MIGTGIPIFLVRGDVYYWGALMAACLIASLPIAFMYNLFLDRFIAGFTVARSSRPGCLTQTNVEREHACPGFLVLIIYVPTRCGFPARIDDSQAFATANRALWRTTGHADQDKPASSAP